MWKAPAPAAAQAAASRASSSSEMGIAGWSALECGPLSAPWSSIAAKVPQGREARKLPAVTDAGPDGALRIGLTISGAVSLGAYEGGALAALLAGVQAVERERPGGLRVDAIAGASAGSITGLLAARALCKGLDPIEVMYRAWVDTPQLDELKDRWDSPLSTERTRKVAEQVLGPGAATPATPVGIRIKLNMALGCLRGLDYEIGRISGPPVQATTYVDWHELTIDGSDEVDGRPWLEAYTEDARGGVIAALASGAHAAAFPPIGLDRSGFEDDYRDNGIANFPPSKFLWYTDGGTIDNEPLGRALKLTEEIDASEHDGIGDESRLHLMIAPDPVRPTTDDDRWSLQPTPPWARTGLRAAKLARSQRLYDDLRGLEKKNSRIEWVRRVERALLDVIERGADPQRTLEDVVREIHGDRRTLTTENDDRRKKTATGIPMLEDRPESEVARALREALDVATGLARKRFVKVAVISPLVLPEVADGRVSSEDVLAGDFLAHFGGFLAKELRENDFSVGYRSTVQWIENGGLTDNGLDAQLSAIALSGANEARADWWRRDHTWKEVDGRQRLPDRPGRERRRVFRLGVKAAVMAIRQLSGKDRVAAKPPGDR